MLKKYLSIVIISSSFAYVYACDANCVACHPKLIKNGKMDNDHKILNHCTRCHTAEENEESHSACGADCWRCHDIRKVGKIDVPEHRVLPKCIECHESIDKHFFNLKEIVPFSQKSIINSLK